ncbi:MAG: DUF4845 domain-containing protein [Burkholderiales bacterium]|nr:DUF4845 domain-containing protein [Burkholderiales bacterium]
MNRQQGLSLTGLLIVSAVVAFTAIVGFKLVPTYIEYFTIKRVINDLSQEVRGGSVRDVQSAFDRRALIDDIKSVNGRDLEISKVGEGFDIRAEYSVQVPLFSNISACIDFVAQNGR